MKKLLTITILFILAITLSGCEDINISPKVCDEGYELIENDCVPLQVTCEDDEVYNENTNQCEEQIDPTCDSGYTLIDGACVEEIQTCSDSELLVGDECVPKTCPIDKELDETGTCVEIVCGENEQLILGECKFIPLVCEAHETIVDNECVLISETCLENEIYYGGECTDVDLICDENFVFQDGMCVSIIETTELDIYYINDFHGAITYDFEEMGLARMANFINAKRAENPNTLFFAGGDILQGSALSNYFLGESTIEILDLMGLDVFALGNHEFDWGLEEVTKYFDEVEENGEADYPLLAVNVFFKGTETRPDYIDPYTIIETPDFKVGVIGAIGANLESSIATKRVEDYEFVDPLPYIEEYAIYLRTVEMVDFVFVVAHDSGNINDAVIALSGDAEVDAVFNGHSHSTYAYINEIPILQSGGNGENLGHVEFVFEDDLLVETNVTNLDIYDDSLFHTPDAEVQALIDFYLADTEALFNTPLITAGQELYSNQLTEWIAELIRVRTGADIAFHNYGGTRRSIDNNTEITIGILYEVWPFDNVIKTVYLTGDEINALLSGGSNGYSSAVDTFESDTLYLVATNDYVFDKPTNPFIYGADPINTGILLRDLAIDEMILQSTAYDSFLFSNPILTEEMYPE